MTILSATDFSPSSHQATHLAASLARRTGDDLLVVHVVQPLLEALPYLMPGAGTWELAMKSSAEVVVAGELKTLRDRGLSATAEVVFGSPGAAILSLIEQRKPRLLVMGTHGRKGIGRLFLGSVASHVLEHATCPVLITRGGSGLSERWDGEFPLRLAVGLDGTGASISALRWLASWPPAICEPALVRLYWPFEEAVRYGIHASRGEEANLELLPLLERDVRHLAASILGTDKDRRSFCVAHVNAAEALTGEAVRLGTDALVVGVPRGRREKWNALAVDEVLHLGRFPVFCVPQTPGTTSHALPEFRSALLATDLSETSSRAVRSAYGALQPGGRVELVHVHINHMKAGPATPFAEPPLIETRPLSEEARDRVRDRLQALVPAGAAERGIVTNVSVIEAPDVATALLQAAERFDVDFLALASHQRRGVKRTVLGSVAEEVTRRSRRPVLITAIDSSVDEPFGRVG